MTTEERLVRIMPAVFAYVFVEFFVLLVLAPAHGHEAVL